jgi:hypothetical protein
VTVWFAYGILQLRHVVLTTSLLVSNGIFQVLSKTEDAIMVIAVILQRMRSADDALRVLKHFIGTSCVATSVFGVWDC